jgi:hypothetical protein
MGNGDLLPHDAWMAYLDNFQIWIQFKHDAMKKKIALKKIFSFRNMLKMVLCFPLGIKFYLPLCFNSDTYFSVN